MAATTTIPIPAYEVQPAPFPATSKTTSGIAASRLTTVTTLSFTDKLLIIISQPSRPLSHWVHVPLATSSTDSRPLASSDSDNALLPRTDLTATTVLGGTKRDDEVVGQTLATTIATAVLMKRSTEERLLVVGLGLQGLSESEGMGRQGFDELVGLCLDCL